MAELVTTSKMTKRFRSLTAVNQVDFRVREGQSVGIIGPNGSGKTTLFNLLSGYFPPTEGKITFQGRDVTGRPSYERVTMGMARTFQLVSVFNTLTVWENLVLSTLRRCANRLGVIGFFFGQAGHRETVRDCEIALDRVGLLKDWKKRTHELSYGDKRMLEIAIALSLKPQVLLLDEPFAGLSDHEIGQVSGLIRLIQKDLTVVIIEHKISQMKDLVERLWVMNEGRLICEGTPEEVLSDPQVRECYWGNEGAA
jgi:branched-chain amino acid transport system ATP-binding protein